jgi:hypothetical protein
MNKNPMYKTLFLSFCCLLALDSEAQTTINATGNSATIQGNVFEYSIGEMVLVNTTTSANLIVTQGLLQPTNNATKQTTHLDLSSIEHQVLVFPNPTENILFVQPTLGLVVNSILVFDATGKQIFTMLKPTLATKYKLNLTSFATGNYFLAINTSDALGNEKVQSFKIQKNN